jgi:transcriptional regulator with XRE-family HTH domain
MGDDRFTTLDTAVIARLRDQKGLTQKAIAEELKISPGYVGAWFKGGNLRRSNAARLAKILGADLANILARDQPELPPDPTLQPREEHIAEAVKASINGLEDLRVRSAREEQLALLGSMSIPIFEEGRWEAESVCVDDEDHELLKRYGDLPKFHMAGEHLGARVVLKHALGGNVMFSTKPVDLRKQPTGIWVVSGAELVALQKAGKLHDLMILLLMPPLSYCTVAMKVPVSAAADSSQECCLAGPSASSDEHRAFVTQQERWRRDMRNLPVASHDETARAVYLIQQHDKSTCKYAILPRLTALALRENDYVHIEKGSIFSAPTFALVSASREADVAIRRALAIVIRHAWIQLNERPDLLTKVSRQMSREESYVNTLRHAMGLVHQARPRRRHSSIDGGSAANTEAEQLA